MEVVESLNDGSVKLVLWKTHAGHSADISRTFLSSSERNWLAGQYYVDSATAFIYFFVI